MINKETYINLPQNEINESFGNFCIAGNLEMVKYLLTSNQLKNKAKIHQQRDFGLRFACAKGHLDIVEYLLTNDELKNHANIHADNGSSFIYACEKGQLEIVKYLLTSPDLTEHANIHSNNDGGFIRACNFNQIEIIKYLIFDMNIEKTVAIKEYLIDNLNEQIENMFKIRELNKYLEQKLKENNIKQKRIKVKL